MALMLNNDTIIQMLLKNGAVENEIRKYFENQLYLMYNIFKSLNF